MNIIKILELFFLIVLIGIWIAFFILLFLHIYSKIKIILEKRREERRKKEEKAPKKKGKEISKFKFITRKR